MKGFSTNSLHNFKEERKNAPHVLPIYTTSSFTFETLEDSIEVFQRRTDGHVYSRYGNPTVQTTENQIAALETLITGLDAQCLMTSSGMSAIHVLISAICQKGDAVLSAKRLYGGTTELFEKVLKRQGIDFIYTDDFEADKLNDILRIHPHIKVLYLETPSNPTMHCIDLKRCAQWAKDHKVETIVDNTFCTPFIQKPLTLGIDHVIYSTTKYLNGHGSGIAGAIVSQHIQFIDENVRVQLKLSGGTCSPFEAWLVHTGLKTLELRMQRHSENAMALAEFLQSHPAVSQVFYPGLETHSTHDIASVQMDKYFGGMLSFDIKGGQKAVSQLVKSLKIATYAPTLGDVDTLIMHPATSSHQSISKEDQKLEGVTDGLLRVSVGIENREDIIADFEQALGQLS